MVENNTIVRIQCRDRENWIKLIKKGMVNAIDLCLELYEEDEIRELNNVLKHSNKFLLVHATPIISVVLLLIGRVTTLFQEIYNIETELTLNDKASSIIKNFSINQDSDIEIITKILSKAVSTTLKNTSVNVIVKHHKENIVAVRANGITYSGKKRLYNLVANLITEYNHIQTFSNILIELLEHITTILRGFLTPLNLGKVEGLYTIIMAKMFEKSLIEIVEMTWKTI